MCVCVGVCLFVCLIVCLFIFVAAGHEVNYIDAGSDQKVSKVFVSIFTSFAFASVVLFGRRMR